MPYKENIKRSKSKIYICSPYVYVYSLKFSGLNHGREAWKCGRPALFVALAFLEAGSIRDLAGKAWD